MADPQLEIYYNMALHGLGLAPTTGVQVPLRRKTGELVDASVTIQKTVLPGPHPKSMLVLESVQSLSPIRKVFVAGPKQSSKDDPSKMVLLNSP